ncbi:MAG: uracil-DNA glycosylase [Holosporales bacterium]|nr:uracil-DNA glycosylase [Holosporales bacterium]
MEGKPARKSAVYSSVHEESSTGLTNQEADYEELGKGSIEDLKRAVLELDCPLKKMSKNTVFSDGTPGSDIMLIGEAPGQEEDEQGKPFVGQSGMLLNNMLMSIGVERRSAYITNVVYWRPPGNRTPSADEVALCLPYVKRHIILAKPKVIVLLGGVAVRAILDTNVPISRLRGVSRKALGIDVVPTFHPAYLLRSPSQKLQAFKDFLLVRKILRISA